MRPALWSGWELTGARPVQATHLSSTALEHIARAHARGTWRASVRILHTADWHLGRIFHGVHLTEDQAYTLDDLCRLAKDARADVVVLAGDLYDRAVPPPDAVALLDEVLARLVLDGGATVLAIAGNHDSPERVAFGHRLLEHARLHVAGRASPPLVEVKLDDEHGPVSFHLLPFAEPSYVRERYGREPRLGKGPPATAVEGHGAALSHLVGRAAAGIRGGRHVVVAHGSVAGGLGADSERPLYIGSTTADAAIFAPFTYAALGHHHRAQDVGGERVRYPGSLLAYSFAEAEHVPSVSVVEIDGRGALHREALPLRVRHAVKVLRGTMKELQALPPDEAYLKIVLTDDAPVLDPLARLAQRFPSALMLEQERLLVEPESELQLSDTRLDDGALFSAFFTEMTGSPPSADEQAVFREVLDRVFAEERESEVP